MFENNFKYGYVIGLIVSSEGDGTDVGRYPDVIPADVKVTFTRVRGQYKQPLNTVVNGINSMLVNHKPVLAAVDSNGYITGDVDPVRKVALSNSTPGLWLVTGLYKVSLGGLLPDFEIEVTEENTIENPLDIADWINYSAPAGSAVRVVSIPVADHDGQLMQWSGGEIVWRDKEILAGPPNVLTIGEVTSTTGRPSATISGDSPNQVLSFQLQKGDKGDQGVIGPQGPPGSVTTTDNLISNSTPTSTTGWLPATVTLGNLVEQPNTPAIVATSNGSITLYAWSPSTDETFVAGDSVKISANVEYTIPEEAADKTAAIQVKVHSKTNNYYYNGAVININTGTKMTKVSLDLVLPNDFPTGPLEVAFVSTKVAPVGSVLRVARVVVSRIPEKTVSTTSSAVLYGPGRPDQVSTTNGAITGNESVGSEYRSTDGANVGAWVWRKRPTGWVVVDGDTGWRDIRSTCTNWHANYANGFPIFARRTNSTLQIYINGMQATAGGTIPANTRIVSIPTDVMGMFGGHPIQGGSFSGAVGRGVTNAPVILAGLDIYIITSLYSDHTSSGSLTLPAPPNKPWPTTLPGTAA